MSDPREEIDRLQGEASGLPYGPAKVALLEEAVRHADTLQDVNLAFQLRQDLMTAANFSGRPDIMLVAFAWCLAEHDRQPDRFDLFSLLWKYKWVVSNASGFPEIERPRLEQLLADMERRYREAGAGMFAVLHERRGLMIDLGERAAARDAHAAFRRCRRDYYSNCPACVASDDIGYHVFQKHWRRAIQAARPILEGHLTCTEEPHRALNKVLLPLFLSGQAEEARRIQELGYRYIRQASHFIKELACQLRFAVLVGNPAQARRIVERHLAGAQASVMVNERLAYLLAARLWTDSLLRRGTTRIKVRLPEELPAADARGERDVVELGQWFTEQAQAIAARFDARNGNDYYRQEIAELPGLLRLAVE